MAVVLEIIDLVVCRKIHGCGCVADDPASKGKWEVFQTGVHAGYADVVVAIQ